MLSCLVDFIRTSLSTLQGTPDSQFRPRKQNGFSCCSVEKLRTFLFDILIMHLISYKRLLISKSLINQQYFTQQFPGALLLKISNLRPAFYFVLASFLFYLLLNGCVLCMPLWKIFLFYLDWVFTWSTFSKPSWYIFQPQVSPFMFSLLKIVYFYGFSKKNATYLDHTNLYLLLNQRSQNYKILIYSSFINNLNRILNNRQYNVKMIVIYGKTHAFLELNVWMDYWCSDILVSGRVLCKRFQECILQARHKNTILFGLIHAPFPEWAPCLQGG